MELPIIKIPGKNNGMQVPARWIIFAPKYKAS